MERLSTSESAAWWGLMRMQTTLVREVDEALRAAHDLPLSWYDVLCELASAPHSGRRMGELAQRVLLTRPGLSGLVDRLEGAGLVERRPCPGDARGIYVVVTSEGLDRLRLAERTHCDIVRGRYTSHLDDAELALIGALWGRLGAVGPWS